MLVRGFGKLKLVLECSVSKLKLKKYLAANKLLLDSCVLKEKGNFICDALKDKICNILCVYKRS